MSGSNLQIKGPEKMNSKTVALLFLSVLILSGCDLLGVQKNILEDNLLAEGVGFDAEEEGKIKSTAVVTSARTGKDVPAGKEIYQSVSYSAKSTRQKMESQTPYPVVSGRLEVIVYGADLAKKGLFPIVDTYSRDPSIGRKLTLAVAEGRAEPLVKLEKKQAESPGVKLKEIITQNHRYNLPDVNLHSFLYSYYGKGRDPVMPLLGEKNGGLEVRGIALFKDDRYTGEYIPYRDGFLFKVLYENFKKGLYEVELEEGYLAMNSIKSKTHYTIKHANTEPEVKMDVELNGYVLEREGRNMKEQGLSHYEQETAQIIKKKMEKMIELFQKKNIDPLGIGERARSHTRNFNFKRWDDRYPDIPIKLNVKVKLLQTGISE